jgi:hypothetical protein
MRFEIGHTYLPFTKSEHKFVVTDRFEEKGMVRGYTDYADEADYKIKYTNTGSEYVHIKRCIFEAI